MDVSVLALQAVGGFTVGALIGYALRKVLKWLLLALGILMLPTYFLWTMGVIEVNWSRVNELVGRFMQWLGIHVANAAQAMAASGVLGFSMLAGFVMGAIARQTVWDCGAGRRFVRKRSA